MFDSGGVHYNSGVGNKAASLMTDGGTFNGYTVSGLGLAKMWKIYYTTENMLISGADYYDLYLALPAACRNLVGVAGTGITATNCAQVDKVVRATEMNKNPTVADSFTPWSTSCPSSTPSRHTLFAEGFESGSTWLRSGTGWYQSQSAAMQATGLASRVDGKGSYMWMPGENVGTARLTQPGTWKVPTTGHVYVRYNMQYAMYEFSSDRLQFQASTDGGTSWSTLVTHTGLSNGWGSVRTDIGTSTYHGKSVKFRFSGVDDAQPLGWVDDLRLYTCT